MFRKKTSNDKRYVLRYMLFALTFLLIAVFIAACGNQEKSQETASAEKQLWTCGMHPQVILEEPGNCPICGMKLVPLKSEAVAATSPRHEHSEEEQSAVSTDISSAKNGKKQDRKILYWRAPMDPTYISEKPGKSPMGMDLIPVYEGEEDLTGGPTVVIDPVTVQNIGVRTALVEKKDLYRAIRTVGHLDYDEEKLYRVNVKFSGWIEKLMVDETGQQVHKGQPMLEIYSPELVTTQEEYLLALKNAKKLGESPFEEISEGTRSLLESTHRRLLYWDITAQQIKDLEEKGIISKSMTLFSPVDGIVISKTAEQGMHVMPGMDLYRIADLSTIWVYVHIYEYELPWIKKGQTVAMDLPYIPGEVFKGKVEYIYPYLDQKTRDVKLRLVFPNPDLKLKPEMYANIQIKSKLGNEVLAVPDEAVLHGGKRNIVFVAKGEGKFEPREVVLGPEAEGGYYQVIAGLQSGEEVVTSAQFLLDSESRLKEAIQKMLEIRMKSKEEQKVPNQ